MTGRLVVAAATVAVISAALLGTAVAQSLKQRTNPDAGLTSAERDANHAAARSEFQARYEQWLADWNSSGADPRTLEQVEINAFYEAPVETLAQAVEQADVIVVGTAVKMQFTPTQTATLFRSRSRLEGYCRPDGDSSSRRRANA